MRLYKGYTKVIHGYTKVIQGYTEHLITFGAIFH
jgi:hypothetical protein